MNDIYAIKPDAAELEAARAGIIAFRKRNQFATKIELAISFVRERGTATSAELHLLMEIPADVSASTYLAPANRDGRLVKDGKNWSLGPNAPAPEASVVWAQQRPDALLAGAEPGRPDKPKAEVLQVPKFSQQQTSDAVRAAPRYRFGMWSDGQIEIQRNGVQLAALPCEVVEELVMFYASVRSLA